MSYELVSDEYLLRKIEPLLEDSEFIARARDMQNPIIQRLIRLLDEANEYAE